MALGALLSAAALCGQQPAPTPADVPQGFWKILWLHGGPARDAAFFAAVRDLGFDAVSVSGDEDPALPGRYGLRFYRDQVAGKGILELRDADWRAARDAYERTRDPRRLVRPACLSEPATIEKLHAVLDRRLQRALPHHPIAVSLGDEISNTRHANPLDFCTGPACLKRFRAWLAKRYGTVGKLDLAWGTAYESFDEVEPFTADHIRARELQGGSLPANLRPWAEHLEFRDAVLAGAVADLRRKVAAAAPSLPCGLTGLQPPSAYGGHDYRLLMRDATFYEVYDIGGARDLARSLAPPGARQVQTLFAPAAGVALSMVRARFFDLLAHGMAGAIVWSAGDVLGDDLQPTPFGAALKALFEREATVADAVAGAELVPSPVWLVESQASVRAHWMIDSIADGRTWIRRLSSHEAKHSTSLAARRSWVRLVEDLGFQPRLVPVQDLRRELRRAPPRVLILPALLALSDDAAAAVTEFVEVGGTALADHGLGLYDEHLRLRSKGVLDRLFGLQERSVELRDHMVRQGVPEQRARTARGAAVAEARLSANLAEPAGEFRIFAENRAGEGHTVYLNLAVCEYAAVRLDPSRHATALDLRQRVRRVLWGAGARPPVLVRADGLPTCIERTELRARDGRRLLAVRVNALDDPAMMQTIGARGPRRVELTFPRPVALRDLQSGKSYPEALCFELELDPWSGLVLELVGE